MISICIPTYRGADRLKRLFDSLSGWNCMPGLEVLIGDDGSPPDDARATEQVCSEQLPHLRTRACLFGENRGCVRVQSELVASSRGDVVLLFDDDALFTKGLLDTVKQLTLIPHIGVLSWRSFGDSPGQSKKAIRGYLQPATQLASYCMAFTRTVYDRIGGLDTRFRHYCADSDFALRATLAGYPSYRVWWPLVPHEEHAAFLASPELDMDGNAARDVAAFNAKWGADGAEMERRALAELTS